MDLLLCIEPDASLCRPPLLPALGPLTFGCVPLLFGAAGAEEVDTPLPAAVAPGLPRPCAVLTAPAGAVGPGAAATVVPFLLRRRAAFDPAPSSPPLLDLSPRTPTGLLPPAPDAPGEGPAVLLGERSGAEAMLARSMREVLTDCAEVPPTERALAALLAGAKPSPCSLERGMTGVSLVPGGLGFACAVHTEIVNSPCVHRCLLAVTQACSR